AAVVVAESLAAKSSATVRVIVKLPKLAYVCDAVGDAAEVSAVPSPQLHVYVVIVPTLSVEFAPLTATTVPAWPEYGPPGIDVGPITNGADAASPLRLYALTATMWRPLVNGSGIEQPHGPASGCGVKP